MGMLRYLLVLCFLAMATSDEPEEEEIQVEDDNGDENEDQDELIKARAAAAISSTDIKEEEEVLNKKLQNNLDRYGFQEPIPGLHGYGPIPPNSYDNYGEDHLGHDYEHY